MLTWPQFRPMWIKTKVMTAFASSASSDRAAIRAEFASADATEKARAEAAEAANAAAISAEESRAQAAEAVNAAAVETEKTRAEAAEATLTSNLASLTSTVSANKASSESADTSATSDRAAIRSPSLLRPTLLCRQTSTPRRHVLTFWKVTAAQRGLCSQGYRRRD